MLCVMHTFQKATHTRMNVCVVLIYAAIGCANNEYDEYSMSDEYERRKETFEGIS